MNILITGGSGLIGSRLINNLLKNRKNCITATYFKNKIQLNHSRLNKIRHSEKTRDIRNIVKKKDIIIHTAAIDKKLSEKKPKLAYKLNLDYTSKIFVEASKQNVKKFIYFSTSQVYGNDLKGIVKENHKTNCKKNVYAFSHLLAEKNIFFNKDKLKSKITIYIIRLSNSFGVPKNSGPRIWNPIINEFSLQALNKGKIIIEKPFLIKNFIPLISVEKLISLFLKKNNSKDILCNFGGVSYSLFQIAKIVKQKISSIFDVNVQIFFRKKKIKKIKKLKYSSKINFINKIFKKKDFEKEIFNLLKFIKKNKNK